MSRRTIKRLREEATAKLTELQSQKGIFQKRKPIQYQEEEDIETSRTSISERKSAFEEHFSSSFRSQEKTKTDESLKEDEEEVKEEIKRSSTYGSENADFQERTEEDEEGYPGGEYMLRDNVIDEVGMAYQQRRQEGMEEA